jgi:glycosyltransferase involved in cell wall biosynthesis
MCECPVTSRPIWTMPAILVEGWRFLPQSFALVNQYQCLELLRRTEVNLYHYDAPIYPPWTVQRGLFEPAQEDRLAMLSAPPSGVDLDAVFRIYSPYDFGASRASHTCVFITCEMGTVPPVFLGSAKLRDAVADSDVTLITPSDWSAQGLVHDGADGSRIRVVPHGVDVDVYYPLESGQRMALRKRLGCHGQFVFLNTSAMTSNKGIGLLLQAFVKVVRRYPQSRLILKGLDSLYRSHESLRSVALGLSSEELRLIQPRIIYLGGNLTQHGMAELYQAADAYVSPYLGEGFNLPVLEAMACGLPVICTKGGSTEDFITSETALRIESTLQTVTTPEGQEQYYLAPSLEHLTDLMIRTIENDTLRHVAHDAGPAHVRAKYTWRHVVDQLLDVLLRRQGKERQGDSAETG